MQFIMKTEYYNNCKRRLILWTSSYLFIRQVLHYGEKTRSFAFCGEIVLLNPWPVVNPAAEISCSEFQGCKDTMQ